jgi:hypothetical protein
MDATGLERRVKSLKTQGQNESQIRALKAFEEALGRRRSGKPDGAPWRDCFPEN